MSKVEKVSPEQAEQTKSRNTLAFGLVLRRYRTQLKVSQEQLSWEASVDRKFISRIERGQREPCLETIIKLTRALEIPLGEFMGEVENIINT